MRTKLHRWAISYQDRPFVDIGSLVYDPAFQMVAWHQVRVNVRARTAGLDASPLVRSLKTR